MFVSLITPDLCKICDAEEGDEDVYACCVSKDGATDCVQIELRVLVVCDTENEEQYTVSRQIQLHYSYPKQKLPSSEMLF